MREIKTKTALSAVFLVLLTGLLILGALGQQYSMGKGYLVYYLNGKEIGALSEDFDLKAETLSARKEIMREHPGEYLLFSAEGSYEEGNEAFRKLDSIPSLREKLKEEMRALAEDGNRAAITVRTGEFSASFRTKEEAEEFLYQSKAAYDPDGSFHPVLTECGDHEAGTAEAALQKKDSGEEETKDIPDTEGESTLPERTYGRAGILPAFLNAGKRAQNAEYVGAGVSGVFYEAFSGILRDPFADFYETGLVDMSYMEPVFVYLSTPKDGAFDEVDEAVTRATREEEKNKIYTVKSGDTLSQIAESYHLTLDRLLEMNEFTNANDTIHIDQELIVSVPEPELKIRSMEGVILEEDFMANPVYIPNNQWYTTEEKIVSEGTIGHREVNAFLVYENGTKKDRINAHTRVLKESIPTKIERGTIVPPTYIKPISGGRFTSGFGRRWGRMHKGVDWACPTGTIVFASSNGVVEYAGWGNGYGNTILIAHPDGRKTRVGHLSKILVQEGQSVTQGQTIGLSGSTGRSTGPHVHFEIYINGTQVNPLDYIS